MTWHHPRDSSRGLDQYSEGFLLHKPVTAFPNLCNQMAAFFKHFLRLYVASTSSNHFPAIIAAYVLSTNSGG